MGFNPWMVLVLILVFYLLLGCLMELVHDFADDPNLFPSDYRA